MSINLHTHLSKDVVLNNQKLQEIGSECESEYCYQDTDYYLVSLADVINNAEFLFGSDDWHSGIDKIVCEIVYQCFYSKLQKSDELLNELEELIVKNLKTSHSKAE